MDKLSAFAHRAKRVPRQRFVARQNRERGLTLKNTKENLNKLDQRALIYAKCETW
jgi:hypothetical protein